MLDQSNSIIVPDSPPTKQNAFLKQGGSNIYNQTIFSSNNTTQGFEVLGQSQVKRSPTRANQKPYGSKKLPTSKNIDVNGLDNSANGNLNPALQFMNQKKVFGGTSIQNAHATYQNAANR
jgi:hypothetical protein